MVWCDRRSRRHPHSMKSDFCPPSGCAADYSRQLSRQHPTNSSLSARKYRAVMHTALSDKISPVLPDANVQ
jgi:hypothetical protein